MPASGKGHVPSQARALIQEAKRRGPRGSVALVDKARALGDPYFVADVLFFMSGNPTLSVEKALALALEAVTATGHVDQDWRRAEILAELARQLAGWRDEDRDSGLADAKQAVEDALVDRVLALPPGKGLSDAIQGVAARLDPHSRHVGTLFSRALGHEGFALDDAKAVVRAWARDLGRDLDEPTLEGVVHLAQAAPDAGLRAHVLGYVHLQAKKATKGKASSRALDTALATLPHVPEDGRVDALRYLATVAHDESELKRVREAADVLPDAEARVRLLSTLGGFADKRGLRALAKAWLDEGARVAEQVEHAAARAVTRANLAKGYARSGAPDAARALVGAAKADVESVPDAAERLRVSHRVRAAADGVGIRLPEDWPPGVADFVEAKASPATTTRPVTAGPRDALVLVGAYEGGLTPAHVRAIARAAPLCDAFGMDLVLVGFPTRDARDLAQRVVKDTNVGGGGRHVRALVDADRLRLEPEDVAWSGLADVVIATTSRPDPRKALAMGDAVQSAGKGGRVALVMGLGKHGLPKGVLDAAPHHLELTGARVSFETAVAMGVMVERLRAAREGVGGTSGQDAGA